MKISSRFLALLLSCLLLCSLVLSACGTASAPESGADSVETVSGSPTPEPTPVPEPTPTPGPTIAPLPRETDVAASAGVELEPLSGKKSDGIITVLCCGIDDASLSTDTIILGRIDTRQHKMNFVSIPRDLLINVPWDCRKINSVYAGSKGGEEGVKALLTQIKRLTGFDVDYYCFINLFCFCWAVEAIGGIWFDVPMEMSYMDEAQDLYIELKPGYQLLNSYNAMGLVRYRYEYENGDLGRIDMQQAFLKSALSQLISARNIPNFPFLLRIAKENMITNMSVGNMAWMAYQLFRTKPENINFYTMPVDTFLLRDYSYAVCRIWEWIPMLNELLNPTDEEIGWGNVDIVYYDGEKYAGSAGYLSEDWYYKE